ncbi:MAG: hypothetical protein ACM3JD_13875 [Rudaea sp.]
MPIPPPSLPETRVAPEVRVRRERLLPVRGEVATAVGSRLEPLDVIARAVPPRARRAISLTRVLGVREADVPRRLKKLAGDSVQAREIIIARPINLGLQQLVYRAPGAGQIVSIKGSWLVLDLDGMPVDLKALYRGSVVSVTPRLGATIEAQGALVQGIWGSGKEGYGVIKPLAKTPDQIAGAESLDVETRGAILVAGAGIGEDAMRRADSLHAGGLITGSLDPRLIPVAQALEMPVLVTEGFGRAPMSVPIFELLISCAGQEASVNATKPVRGDSRRPEVFIPLVTRPGEAGTAREPAPLTAEPGARVRVLCEPYLGRVGVLPQELLVKWIADESGLRLPSVQIELQDAGETESVLIPLTDLELIG